MRARRTLLLCACLFAAVISLVGTGFAYFVFGGNSISAEGTVQVTPAERAELGTVTVNGSYTYGILFDTDSVRLYRSDNITKDAPFDVACDLTASTVNIPSGYNVALVCDITVSDDDSMGFIPFDGNSTYCYSNSLVDYLLPTHSASDSTSSAFVRIDGTDKSAVYRCVLAENVNDASAVPQFTLKLAYRDYSYNGVIGSMSPSGNISDTLTFQTVMDKIHQAGNNSHVDITFRLVLQEAE